MIKEYFGTKTRVKMYGSASCIVQSWDHDTIVDIVDPEDVKLMAYNIYAGEREYGLDTPAFADYMDRLVATYF